MHGVTHTNRAGRLDKITQAGRFLCVPIALSFGLIEASAESLSPMSLEEGARHFHQLPDSNDSRAEYEFNLDRELGVYPFGNFRHEEAGLSENLITSADWRYDPFGTFSEVVERGVSLVYGSQQSAIKVEYSEAYLGWYGSDLRQSAYRNEFAHQIEPEKVRSYAVSMAQKFGSVFRAAISGFFVENSLDDQENNRAPNLFGFSAINRQTAYGAEAEIEAKWESGISSRLSYAYAIADENTPRSGNGDSPRHLGRLNFFLPVVHEILFAGLELQTSSSRVMMAGNDAKEYAIMNTILFAKSLAKRVDVTAIVYNLFDSRTGYVGSGAHWQDLVYQDARTFKLKLTYQF